MLYGVFLQTQGFCTVAREESCASLRDLDVTVMAGSTLPQAHTASRNIRCSVLGLLVS